MFGKNRPNDCGAAALPDPRDLHYQMREKIAQSTDCQQAQTERVLNGRAVDLHSAEMALTGKYEEFQKFVHVRLDEFRSDLNLMAKFHGMEFKIVPEQRVLVSIDGPDPRVVSETKVAAAVTDKVCDMVTEMLGDFDNGIDARLGDLNVKLRALADLINSKKKR
jgi:hypothetical protein